MVGGKRKPALSSNSPSVPPVPATLVTYQSLADMDPDDAAAYVGQLIDRLGKKQGRERNYLKRRADQGRRTPTDEVMEADQILEDEIRAVLDELYQGLLNGLVIP